MSTSRTATGRVTRVRVVRRRAVSAQPASSTTAPTARRYQAMSSGERSVRSATIRPLMPDVPQHSAARTTSRNPRRDAGEETVFMTLLGADPDGTADPERAEGRTGTNGPGRGGGQPRGAPVRSGEGAGRGHAGASWGEA